MITLKIIIIIINLTNTSCCIDRTHENKNVSRENYHSDFRHLSLKEYVWGNNVHELTKFQKYNKYEH